MPYKADSNQAGIIADLLRAGCSVSIIGGANGNTGVPDLLVGRVVAGEPRCYVLEVKAEDGRLSAAQKRWHANWRGQKAVVRTSEEAFRAVGLLR